MGMGQGLCGARHDGCQGPGCVHVLLSGWGQVREGKVQGVHLVHSALAAVVPVLIQGEKA